MTGFITGAVVGFLVGLLIAASFVASAEERFLTAKYKRLEEENKEAGETIGKYIDKHNELIRREKEIQSEGAKVFAKFLIDKAMDADIGIDEIVDLAIEWAGDDE